MKGIKECEREKKKERKRTLVGQSVRSETHTLEHTQMCDHVNKDIKWHTQTHRHMSTHINTHTQHTLTHNDTHIIAWTKLTACKKKMLNNTL